MRNLIEAVVFFNIYCINQAVTNRGNTGKTTQLLVNSFFKSIFVKREYVSSSPPCQHPDGYVLPTDAQQHTEMDSILEKNTQHPATINSIKFTVLDN